MGIEFSYAAETAFVSPTLLEIGVIDYLLILLLNIYERRLIAHFKKKNWKGESATHDPHLVPLPPGRVLPHSHHGKVHICTWQSTWFCPWICTQSLKHLILHLLKSCFSLSDRCNSTLGRRRPFIILLSVKDDHHCLDWVRSIQFWGERAIYSVSLWGGMLKVQVWSIQ